MLDQNGEFISRFDELNINSEYFSENALFTNLNRQRVRGFKKHDISTLVNNKLQDVKHWTGPIVLDSGKCLKESVFDW